MAVRPQKAADVATVMSVSGEAATVVTKMDAPVAPPPSHRTLRPSPNAEPTREGAKPKRRGVMLAISLLLLLGLGWTYFSSRRKATEPPVTTAAVVPQPQHSAEVPVAVGHLGINAYPWGTVTSIRNVSSGESIDLGSPLVTPAPIDLAPGRYEVTLTHPDYPRPITRTVDVTAGREETLNVQFADPATASLPRFEGTR